jgi:hypothetical protein
MSSFYQYLIKMNIALGIANVLYVHGISSKLFSTKDPNKFIFVSEIGDEIIFEFCPRDRYSISVQSTTIQNMSFGHACQHLESLLTVHIWG